MLPYCKFWALGQVMLSLYTRLSSPSGPAVFITGFSSMKYQGVLAPGWDASPLQG